MAWRLLLRYPSESGSSAVSIITSNVFFSNPFFAGLQRIENRRFRERDHREHLPVRGHGRRAVRERSRWGTVRGAELHGRLRRGGD